MSTGAWHLAQYNVATMVAPLDSPQLADFVAELDRLNGLADVSPGFVWRLQDDSGASTGIRVEGESDRVLVNFTVWESIDQLFEYTYKSSHNSTMVRRGKWFEKHSRPHLVLWWVPAGYIPTLEQAIERLDDLRANGPTQRAFTMKQRFDPPQSGNSDAAG
jgi:Domain of unknown function (DUF3291)